MSRLTEKQLDAALKAAFLEKPGFLKWFIERTKFSGRDLRIKLIRDDNQWGTVPYSYRDRTSGEEVTIRKQCETDVLVVLEDSSGEVVAIHIENKTSSGSFTPLQPELYAARAKHWREAKKFGGYTDFDIVLVAPEAFRERNRAQAEIFAQFISHEDIAEGNEAVAVSLCQPRG